MLSGAADLLGAGPGLTPSWDDLLAGLLLLDHRFGRNVVVVPESFWTAAARQTTVVSLWHLRLAAAGQSALAWEEAANRLGTARMKMAEWVRLLGWGATSGTDLLIGWVMALESGIPFGV